MKKDAAVFVAGHRGMVGSAIVRALSRAGYTNLLLRTRAELDLRDERAVRAFYAEQRPRYVFIAAARVGGIMANNTFPVEFLVDNLRVQNNLIEAAYESDTEKLLFLGSSCIYPKLAPQPLREDSLLTGPLEPTNEAYAIAKIAGIKLCQYMMREYGKRFISAMPTNLYGPNDNYDLQSSHVLPALIRRFHVAKVGGAPSVTLWGTGTPLREFLHADDLAEACLFLMDRYEGEEHVNVGVGEDLPIRDLAEIVRRVVGYSGDIGWDSSKPDGTPRKLMDVTRIHSLGWRHKIELEAGLRTLYDGLDTLTWI
jgi:GDP-L-fucose synthase